MSIVCKWLSAYKDSGETTHPRNKAAEWYGPDAAFSLWSCCWGGFRVTGRTRARTGGDMAFGMTARCLRNNPIQAGLNVRILFVLCFVSGMFARALFAVSWARKGLIKFGGIQWSVYRSIERVNVMPSRLVDSFSDVTARPRLCRKSFQNFKAST